MSDANAFGSRAYDSHGHAARAWQNQRNAIKHLGAWANIWFGNDTHRA